MNLQCKGNSQCRVWENMSWNIRQPFMSVEIPFEGDNNFKVCKESYLLSILLILLQKSKAFHTTWRYIYILCTVVYPWEESASSLPRSPQRPMEDQVGDWWRPRSCGELSPKAWVLAVAKANRFAEWFTWPPYPACCLDVRVLVNVLCSPCRKLKYLQCAVLACRLCRYLAREASREQIYWRRHLGASVCGTTAGKTLLQYILATRLYVWTRTANCTSFTTFFTLPCFLWPWSVTGYFVNIFFLLSCS